MLRRVPLRLTACTCVLAASAAVGVLLAPAAGAGPARDELLTDHLGSTRGVTPGAVPVLTPAGRKL